MGIESRDYYRTGAGGPDPSGSGRPSLDPPRPGALRYLYLLYVAVLLPMVAYLPPRPPERAFHAGYLLAAVAFVAHMAAVWLLLDPRPRAVIRPLQAAAFTGIAGMALILGIQELADTGGLGVVGRFINYAYGLRASNPISSPFLTFVGHTLSAGLLEESVKALPIIFLLTTGRIRDWRTACLVGLGSGIGFGVCEGIWYHEFVYNRPPLDVFELPRPPAGLPTYLVRFFGGVGAHAIYSGIGALLLYRRFRVGGRFNPIEALWTLFGVMCLHGLYNALGSYGHSRAALATDLGAFFWFVALVEWMKRSEAVAPHRGGLLRWIRSAVGPALTKRRLQTGAAVLAIVLGVLWLANRPAPLPPRSKYDPRDTFVAMLYVHRGWAQVSARRWTEARTDFERALALDSACSPAASTLAFIAGKTGDSAAALSAYRAILEHRPNLVVYRIVPPAELATWCAEVLARDPNDTLGLLMQATLYGDAGDNQRAVAVLNTALTSTPSEVALLLYLGDRYETLGLLDSAHDAYDRAVAARGPLEASALVARARLNSLRGEHEAALADFSAAARFPGCFVAYNHSALCRIALGREVAAAEHELFEYLRQVPDNALAIFFSDEREQAADRLVAANPLEPLSLAIRGDTKRVALRYDAALADAREALRLDADDPFARLLTARLSLNRGDSGAAREELRSLVREHPDFAPAWLTLASCADARRDAAETADAALRTVRLSPRTMRAYRLRAGALRDLGEDRRALDSFSASVGLDGIRDAAESKGTLYFHEFVRPEEAVARLTDRLSRDRADVLGLIWRGNAHRVLGEFDAAALDYSEAARRAPDSPLPLLMLGLLKRNSSPDEAIALFGQAITIGEEWRERPRNMD